MEAVLVRRITKISKTGKKILWGILGREGRD